MRFARSFFARTRFAGTRFAGIHFAGIRVQCIMGTAFWGCGTCYSSVSLKSS